MLRDEKKFHEVVRWMSLHQLKQKQIYKRLTIKQFYLYLHNKWLNYTLDQLKHYLNPRYYLKRYTIRICLPSSLLPTKIQAFSVTCNQLTPSKICWPHYDRVNSPRPFLGGAIIPKGITHLHENRV